jgi:SpoVK/Ycf46/Vps4 family AAA+-type ATPase
VDVAVEIELPDAAARGRLLALYGRGVPLALTPEDIATAIERTEGTTASFLKELIRRSVLESLHDPQGPAAGAAGDGTAQPGERGAAGHGVPTVTGAHLARALDDLLDSAQGVTRTLLGVGVDPATLPAGGALGMSPMAMAQRRMAVTRVFRG